MLVSILLFVLFGFVVGLVAKMLIGGPGGFWETSGVGMAGALIGGLIARQVGWMQTSWSIQGFAVALLGAVVLILVARLVRSAAVRA